ncbi:MAG: hypothetical protein V4489_02220 [Chlamydiota bacterium]
MHTSFISTIRLRNKWQVIKKDLTNLTATPIPHEDYDDEQTAKIAGIILAKMLKLSFVQVNTEEAQEKENSKLGHFP